MGVKEDNCLEAGKLGVVHLDGFEWRHQLVHDSDPDVPDHRVLGLRHPEAAPLADVTGDDHVVTQEQDVVQIH